MVEIEVKEQPASTSAESAGALKKMISAKDNGLLFLLCLTSAMEMFAGVGYCDKRNYCRGYYAWAVSAGAVSLALGIVKLCLFYLQTDFYEKISPFTSSFLFLWWIPGAGVTTFAGPFFAVGNGYIGAWGAFLCSFMLAHSSIVCSWNVVKDKMKEVTKAATSEVTTSQTTETPPTTV